MAPTVAPNSLSSQTSRLRAEQAFHDWQARERAKHFQARPEDLRFTDDAYLHHESWIAPALTALGDVQGQRVLDFGCGHGMAAVVLARRGARVTALDLSGAYVREAQARAAANSVAIQCVQADAERLPFADQSFDAVWGNAIIHHLDIGSAGREIRRVLVPGGRAVFCEPWGENPLLAWARRRLPYPGKERTRDETPLLQNHVHELCSLFHRVEVQGHQLASMAGRLLGCGAWQRPLVRLDDAMLRRFPSLLKWCRYVVVRLSTA